MQSTFQWRLLVLEASVGELLLLCGFCFSWAATILYQPVVADP